MVFEIVDAVVTSDVVGGLLMFVDARLVEFDSDSGS